MANRKETALDLGKLIDKGVIVKLMGGREVHGVLKGYDQLLNLVLDEGVEYLRDPEVRQSHPSHPPQQRILLLPPPRARASLPGCSLPCLLCPLVRI